MIRRWTLANTKDGLRPGWTVSPRTGEVAWIWPWGVLLRGYFRIRWRERRPDGTMVENRLWLELVRRPASAPPDTEYTSVFALWMRLWSPRSAAITHPRWLFAIGAESAGAV